MKKFIIILSCLLLLSLTGCSKQYTLKDVENYIINRGIDASLIETNVEKQSWTFHDNNINEDFHIYEIGKDLFGLSLPNELNSDLNYVYTKYYLDKYDKQILGEITEEITENYITALYITYNFTDRTTLNDFITNAEEITNYLNNCSSLCTYMYKFNYNDDLISFNAQANSLDRLQNVEQEYLEKAIIYADDIILDDFSNEEIIRHITNNPNRIYIKQDSEYIPTIYCGTDNFDIINNAIKKSNFKVTGNVLKKLLIDNNYNITDYEYNNNLYYVILNEEDKLALYTNQVYTNEEIKQLVNLNLILQKDLNKEIN